MTLDDFTRIAIARGYRIERVIEERLIRPDGSVAVITRRPAEDEPVPDPRPEGPSRLSA